MDRNTTIAFVLIGAILIIWLYLNAPEPVEQQERIQDSIDVVQDTSAISLDGEEKEKEFLEEDIRESTDFVVSGDPGRIITVETDLVIYEFSTKGANLHKVFLKNFNNWYSAGINGGPDYYKTSVQLINYSLGNAYDVSFVSTKGQSVNTADFVFETDANESNYILNNGDSLSITFTLRVEEGGSIVRRFKFFGSKYVIESDLEFIGMGNQVSNNAFDIVWDNGLRFVEEDSHDEAQSSNASVYYGDEKVDLDVSAGETEEMDFNGRIDWVSVKNKYFATVIIPGDPNGVEGAYLEGYGTQEGIDILKEFYTARLIMPFRNSDFEEHSFKLYIGPVDYNSLKGLGHNLQAIVDFGSFFGLKFIVRPIAEFLLLPLFNFLHLFIPNYGFVIIVFSLIIKIVVYPLTRKSYQSMKRMQLLQPKISEIKEKYKDDPQRTNKETMKLYQTYGVNPAGGCLPLLLQMPIFIALWGLFRTAIELRQQPFILWIQDLSKPDIIADLGFKLPLFGIQYISALAILMGVTTFLQQKMTMKDPKQQALVYIMPIMLTILFMTFPSGLNLYYFMFNVLSMAQQYYINHKQGDVALEPVKKSKRKQGFMARLMDAAEQQAKTQQKKRR